MVIHHQLIASVLLSKTERFKILHTIGYDGKRGSVKASNGTWFTEIYSSKPNAVGFMTPVDFGNGTEDGISFSEHLAPRDLVVVTHDFDPRKDWAFAVEHPEYGKEGGIHLLFGGNLYKDAYDLLDKVVQARNEREAPPLANTYFAGERRPKAGDPIRKDSRNYPLERIQCFDLMSDGVPPLPQLHHLVYGTKP